MAVEVARDRGVSTHPPEAGAIRFPERLAQELATTYITHVSMNSDNYGNNPYLLGQMEVEGQVLSMLGQEHLLSVGRDQPLPIPRLTRLQPITPRYLEDLIGSYRVAEEFCQDFELRNKRGNPKDASPLVRRVKGRRDTLVNILTSLGKGELVSSTYTKIRMRPDMVDYEKQRHEPTGEVH